MSDDEFPDELNKMIDETDELCMAFSESTVWTFAREVARTAQHPNAQTPEQIADRVLAEVVTARIEVDNDR